MEKRKIQVILPNSELIEVSAYEIELPPGVDDQAQPPRLYVNKTIVVGDDGEPDYDGTWTVTDEPTGAYYLARFPDRETAAAVGEKLYELGAQDVRGSSVRDAALQIRRNNDLLDFMEQAHRETFGYGGRPPSGRAIQKFVDAYRPPATPYGVSEDVAERLETPPPKRSRAKKPAAKKPAAKKPAAKKPAAKKKKVSRKAPDDAASVLLRRRGIDNPLTHEQVLAKSRCMS